MTQQHYGELKPDLEDVLEHYGVLGMKWGKSRAKANGREIRAARRRVAGQANKVIDARDARKSTAKGSTERAKADQKVKSLTANFRNNPDRVVAARLTRGEKAAAIILLTPAGAAAAIGVTSGVSRRIERNQELRKK